MPEPGKIGKAELLKYERVIHKRIRQEEAKQNIYKQFGFAGSENMEEFRMHDFEQQQRSQGAMVTLKEIKSEQ